MIKPQRYDSPDSKGLESHDPDRAAERAMLQPRLAGTNIDENSFLATDYLNHYSEVAMLIDMAASMPEVLDDAAEWRPKSYEAHFTESGFPHGDLAIEAFRIAPADIRRRFDAITARLDAIIPDIVARLIAVRDDPPALAAQQEAAHVELHSLMSALNGVVHAADNRSDQNGIDRLFEV